MLVLGVDPGLAITGYGLVEGDGDSLTALAYGTVRTSATTALAERLMQLHDALTDILTQYSPAYAAVEQLFFGTNARTAISVGQARGVLLLTLAQAHVPIAEYTPLQVKQALTGYGQAGKSQVQQMVRILLCLEEIPRPDDAADALAISICHHHSARMAGMLESRG